MLYGKTITNNKRAKDEYRQTVVISNQYKNKKSVGSGNTITTKQESEIDTLEKDCKNHEVTGIQSMKASEEAGMETETFVHVIKSYMKKNKLPVVVKIHHLYNIFIENELEAYDKLKGFENSVQKICHFSCMDNMKRWEHMIDSPIGFCQDNKDPLHFIVLEYIEHGDIYNFFNKLPNKNIICSFLIQVSLAIAVMAQKYRISYNDLNTGNILIGKTNKTRMHFTVSGQEYRIRSYGITPKFLDYERSHIYEEEPSMNDIMSDVYSALYKICLYIKDLELKETFLKLLKYNTVTKNLVLKDTIISIRNICTNTQ